MVNTKQWTESQKLKRQSSQLNQQQHYKLMKKLQVFRFLIHHKHIHSFSEHLIKLMTNKQINRGKLKRINHGQFKRINRGKFKRINLLFQLKLKFQNQSKNHLFQNQLSSPKSYDVKIFQCLKKHNQVAGRGLVKCWE